MLNNNNIIFSNNFCSDISTLIQGVKSEQIFILTDNNTKDYCYPLISSIEGLKNAKLICIDAGDNNKTIETVVKIWDFMGKNSATRKSLLINLGGGMITDLGGFVANTFKRGIDYINIPTTLLSMVDAAIGGKTGINFNGLKNEIGVINPAKAVIINSEFLKSLNKDNILSGYAEMLKHGLLASDEELNKLLNFDLNNIDYIYFAELIKNSILIKENIVLQDPKEKGIRKALNLGHTIGHAFESCSYKNNKPILHGNAIAWGLIPELLLSHKIKSFDQSKLIEIVRFICKYYGTFSISCKDYAYLYELMSHDKKNDVAGEVNFSLLSAVGEVNIDCIVDKEQIYQALDYYRDCCCY